jgi:hypothetical protein
MKAGSRRMKCRNTSLGYPMVVSEVQERSKCLPIAFSAAVLLGLVWVSVGMTGFGKEARKVLFGSSRTIGKASVVTVSVLVRASHWSKISMGMQDGTQAGRGFSEHSSC